MNRLILTTLGLLLASTALAEDVDRTIDAHSGARVSVSIVEGSLDIVGWDRNEVQVRGTIGDDVEEFVFERDGKDILIKVKVPSRNSGRKDYSANLDIRVPAGSSLDVGTVSADIEVEGVTSEQELQSVSGDVSTEAFAADIDAETVSGDVEIEAHNDRASGEWELSTVSGDIVAIGLSGELEANVVSGDIRVIGGGFSRARIETVSGNLDFSAALAAGGKLDMESVSGNIDLEFEGEVSARFDVESFSGRIKNCFGPKAERTSKYAPGVELSFSEGAGDGRVSLSTLNGNIEICKR
tara:strand:- start:13283 stop:14173 length:891 start_codon:yes stop_codon:yes gene_type:complete